MPDRGGVHESDDCTRRWAAAHLVSKPQDFREARILRKERLRIGDPELKGQVALWLLSAPQLLVQSL